jgi:UDP-N-acetylmuramate: L-alanyl-gamma-D-glutamyl-meso-diaminopimelate ligase
MHVHILGICGTFMGGIAILARQMGYRVTGSDTNVYPPMSTQLEAEGIQLTEGYAPAQLDPAPDWVIVGNALSRGNPAVEYMLDRGLPYISGPQFLADFVLRERWILAVAGTHGKTTTSSMLAWILEYAGLNPGFLVGGVPGNFNQTARLGDLPFFVVEADEYDTAFFDKRSKFVHYRPRTLVLNNLEFDHADIFPDLEAIKRQFHHLVRTVPGTGLIITPGDDAALLDVLSRGCWTAVEYLTKSPAESAGPAWNVELVSPDGSDFKVFWGENLVGRVQWGLVGQHNVQNGLSAIAAARHAGVIADQAVEALNRFAGVKRRLEVRGVEHGVTVYDDFAHHPTAIATTLEGLRKRVGKQRILAVLEPRSNTMRMGVHREALAASLAQADQVFLYQADDLEWDLGQVIKDIKCTSAVYTEINALVQKLVETAQPGDHVLIMSNGAFGGIHQILLEALTRHEP